MKKLPARPAMKTTRLTRAEILAVQIVRAEILAAQIAALQKDTYALLARVDYLVAAWTLKPTTTSAPASNPKDKAALSLGST